MARDESTDTPAQLNVEVLADELADPESAPSLPATTLAAQAIPHAEPEPKPAGAADDADSQGPLTGIRELLRLAWPVMLATGAVTLAGIIDRAMVGRLGDGAGGAAIPLAAVGIATQFFFLVQSSLFAVGLACVALVARAIGARSPRDSQLAFAASIQVAIALSLGLSIPIALGAPVAFAFLGQEEVVISAAIPYLHYVLGSSVMMAVALVIESAMRADKQMRQPMQIAMLVTICKLSLNWLFIFGHWGFPRMELVGAGLATLISQILGLALLLLAIRRRGETSPLHLRWGDVAGHNPRVREILRIAVPGIAERLVMNTAMLSYIWVLGHYYGTLSVAAYTVGIPLLAFTWIPGQAYAQSCATLIGQALGRGKPEEATRIGWQAAGLAVFTAVILGTIVAFKRYSLAGLLTQDEAMIRALGPFLLALSIAQPVLQLQFTLGGAHRGAGDSTTPLIAACVGNWVFRVPLAFGAAMLLDADISWVWYALIFDHIARSLVLGISFHRGKWRDKLAGLEGVAGGSRSPAR